MARAPRTGFGRIALPVVLGLLAVEALLGVAYFLVPTTLLFDFHLDHEANVPTWFSCLQLTLLGTVLSACWIEEASRPADTRPASRGLGWLLLAAGFLFLSLDEFTELHETLGWHLAHSESLHGQLTEVGEEVGARHLASTGIGWVVLLSPVLAAGVGYLVAFLLLRFRQEPRLLVAGLAGVTCFGFTLVCEFLSLWNFGDSGYRTQVAIEELCEMVGATLLLLVGLSTLENRLPRSPRVDARISRVATLLRRSAVVALSVGAILLTTMIRHMGPPLDRGLDPSAWTVSASGELGRHTPANTIDRDPYSRWRTPGSMKPGEWIEVDLGEVRAIQEVCVDAGGYRLDGPRGLTVTSSVVDGLPSLWVDHAQTSMHGPSRLCARMYAPLPAQTVRFTQTDTSDVYAWSVSEIYVYGPDEIEHTRTALPEAGASDALG